MRNMMKTLNRVQTGFTLIEVAIVVVIVSILLGYTVALFPIQQELKQYRQASADMDEIVDALIAFAQVNGRLPCPDTSGNLHVADPNTSGAGVLDGNEDFEDLIDNLDGTAVQDGLPDNCKAFFGFLPSATLGMNGDINANGVLQDPWGGGYGYAISGVDTGGGGAPGHGVDLVSPKGIREEGLSAVVPDLFICDDSTTLGNHTDCTPATIGNQVVGNVAVVIISLGKSFDLGAGSTNIQRENFDDFHNGTLDKVYISTARSEASGVEFDDVVKWISPNQLYSKMIEAGQLP